MPQKPHPLAGLPPPYGGLGGLSTLERQALAQAQGMTNIQQWGGGAQTATEASRATLCCPKCKMVALGKEVTEIVDCPTCSQKAMQKKMGFVPSCQCGVGLTSDATDPNTPHGLHPLDDIAKVQKICEEAEEK